MFSLKYRQSTNSMLVVVFFVVAFVPVSLRAESDGVSRFFSDVISGVAANILSEVIKDYMSTPSAASNVVPAVNSDEMRLKKIILGILDTSTPLEERVSYYARNVDYFSFGVVDHSYIIKDRRRFERRWPYIRYTLVSIDETAMSSDGTYATARYTIDWETKRPGKMKSGIAKVAILVGSFDAQPRIYAIKEWVHHR